MKQIDVARATGLSRQRVNQLVQRGLSLREILARGRVINWPLPRRPIPRPRRTITDKREVYDYLTTTRYIGRPGVVELHAERTPGRRTNYVWSWRFVGCSQLWAESGTKLDALVDAAHSCGLSGARAGWIPDHEQARAHFGGG